MFADPRDDDDDWLKEHQDAIKKNKQERGEGSADSLAFPESTHECPVCPQTEHIQTPYNQVLYYCTGKCDALRQFLRIEEDDE